MSDGNWAEISLRIQRRHRRIAEHLEFKRWDKAAKLQLKNVKDAVKLTRWIVAEKAGVKHEPREPDPN